MWLARTKDQPQPEQAAVLNGIKALDTKLANPAYVTLPLTGVGMVLFSPALRRQVELVANDEAGSEAYTAAARRTTMFGTITMLPVAAILYLMVIKPTP